MGVVSALTSPPTRGPAIPDSFVPTQGQGGLATLVDLNLATMSALPGAVVFARTSSAAFFDPSGTLQSAANGIPRFEHAVADVDLSGPHNLLQWSSDLTHTNTTNGGGATVSSATQVTWSGAGGFGYLLDGAGGAYALEPNTTYVVIANIQLVTGTAQANFRIFDGVTTFDGAPFTITSSVAQYSQTFTTGPTIGAAPYVALQWPANGTWNVTFWQLNKGGATSTLTTTGTFIPPGDLTDKTVPHNLVPNSTFVGAVAGAPGTPPTGWQAPSSIVGAARTIATGTLADGTPYVDITYAGTSTGPGVLAILVAQLMPCAFGQTLYGSLGCSVVAGDMTGFSTWKLSIIERDALNSANASAVVAQPFPPNGTITGQRTVQVASTVRADLRFDVAIPSAGAAINVTFRVTKPQIARGASVPYVATSGTAVAASYPALGLRSEGARTNSTRNGSGTGATPGTPGTMPTGWTLNLADTGLAPQVVGSGTEDGLPYVDLRFSGAAALGSTTNGNQIIIGATTDTAAANAQAWTGSSFLRLVAGTLANVSLVRNGLSQRDGAGAFLADFAGTPLSPSAATLKSQRRSDTFTTNQPTIGFVQQKIFFTTAAGAVDFTLRVSALCLELGPFASSPILTTAGAVTRAAESASIACAPGAAVTVMAKARFAAAPNPSLLQEIASLDDGTANNRIQLRRTQTGNVEAVVGSGGAAVLLSVIQNVQTASDTAIWVATQANDFAANTVTGGTIRGNTATPAPISPTTLHIGCDALNVQPIDGTVAHIAVYAARLDNTTAAAKAALL